MNNKYALITGGSRGIGLGIAQSLAAEGWNLAINGMRPEDSVRETLDGLRAQGIKVIYCQGNVADLQARTAMLDKIKSEFGNLHFLINNAGVAPLERKDILEMTEESYDRVLDINLKGTFFLSQAVANWLVEQKSADSDFFGGIVNVSSISATIASINRGEYCISKAGMSMVTQLFATRLGELNLPVYEVRPGVIMTDMTSGVKGKYDKMIEDGLTVQKRWGYPEDIGKAVAALVRGDFPYSTGQVIMIDGGLTIDRL
ncbi:MAG: 3-ketoacyl-ACP reductase [Bacteroidetes bacterium]|nr:3-ketoacyl-ACP reductase [Bacteroidota bacterium]